MHLILASSVHGYTTCHGYHGTFQPSAGVVGRNRYQTSLTGRVQPHKHLHPTVYAPRMGQSPSCTTGGCGTHTAGGRRWCRSIVRRLYARSAVELFDLNAGSHPFTPIGPARFLWLPHQRRNAGRKHHQTVWTGFAPTAGLEPATSLLVQRSTN